MFMTNKFSKSCVFYSYVRLSAQIYQTTEHLLGHGIVDHVTTFDAGGWSFVPWILTQLWRPPVLAHTIAMSSTNT